MSANPPVPRVLSIQSHVVHGYVGNKCAVLPLNRLGFEVDAINSVQFSNHTGYPTFAGQVMDGQQLVQVLDGLDANGLLRYTHLLTGYIGSLSLLETIAEAVQRLRKINPHLVYGMSHVDALGFIFLNVVIFPRLFLVGLVRCCCLSPIG
jgi:pyridoxine kinase